MSNEKPRSTWESVKIKDLGFDISKEMEDELVAALAAEIDKEILNEIFKLPIEELKRNIKQRIKDYVDKRNNTGITE